MRIDRKPPRAKAYCRPRRRRRSQNGNLGCHFLRADFWTCPLINLSSTTLATSPLNGAQRRMRTAAISVPVTSALVTIISFAIETWQPISAKRLRAEVLVRNEDIRIPGITKMYEVTLTNRVSCLPRLLGATSSMTRCRPAQWWHMPFSAGMKTGNNGGQQSGGAAFWLETQNMRRMRTEITPLCSACTVRTASQQGSSLPVRHAGWAFRLAAAGAAAGPARERALRAQSRRCPDARRQADYGCMIPLCLVSFEAKRILGSTADSAKGICGFISE